MASPAMQAPRLDPWMRNLLIGLFAAYVLELILANLRVPVDVLRLFPFDAGFAWFQPITRFVVQGREAAVNVLISIAVLYFFLPVLPRLLGRRQWVEALGASALVATVLPMGIDALDLLPGAVRTGWDVLIPAIVVIFGLVQPKATIQLMFVLPVQASIFVWATLFFAVFFLLVSPTTASVEPVGAWIGVVSWWQFRGPGSRRRQLLKKADKLERELQRFTVLDGGKAERPQGSQGDDWIH